MTKGNSPAHINDKKQVMTQ